MMYIVPKKDVRAYRETPHVLTWRNAVKDGMVAERIRTE